MILWSLLPVAASSVCEGSWLKLMQNRDCHVISRDLRDHWPLCHKRQIREASKSEVVKGQAICAFFCCIQTRVGLSQLDGLVSIVQNMQGRRHCPTAFAIKQTAQLLAQTHRFIPDGAVSYYIWEQAAAAISSLGSLHRLPEVKCSLS